jgi:CxxC motif-containing protein (DUF1111 family)
MFRESAGVVSAAIAIIVAVLLTAAALGIGMEDANARMTPRVTSLIVGLALVPVLAITLSVYLWAIPHRRRVAGIIGRVLFTLVALAISAYSLVYALFMAFFVG